MLASNAGVPIEQRMSAPFIKCRWNLNFLRFLRISLEKEKLVQELQEIVEKNNKLKEDKLAGYFGSSSSQQL